MAKAKEPKMSKKEEMVVLLRTRVEGLWDRKPKGDILPHTLDKLVDEILNI